jgi:hypothetical protein
MKNPSFKQEEIAMQMKSSQNPMRQSNQQSNNYQDLEAVTGKDREVTVTASWNKASARYDFNDAVKNQHQNLSLFSAMILQIAPLEKEPYWNHHQLDNAICRPRSKQIT